MSYALVLTQRAEQELAELLVERHGSAQALLVEFATVFENARVGFRLCMGMYTGR